jgi:hypothetical protein
MPRNFHVTCEADVAAVLSKREDFVLDFKGPRSPKENDLGENAKDMASFANVLGATILEGAAERPDGSVNLIGLSREDARVIEQAYETARTLHCSPSPVVNTVTIPLSDEKVLLAVNVEPMPDAVVGARYVTKENPKDKRCYWRFPLRSGRDTSYVEPAMFPMMMNPQIRRKIIMLEGIPLSERRRLLCSRGGDVRTASGIVKKEEWFVEQKVWHVDVMRNVLTLRLEDFNSDPLDIPLDDVGRIWGQARGGWRIEVLGHVDDAQYIPARRLPTP